MLSRIEGGRTSSVAIDDFQHNVKENTTAYLENERREMLFNLVNGRETILPGMTLWIERGENEIE